MRILMTAALSLAALAACAPPPHLQAQGGTGFGAGATGYGSPAPATTYGAPAPYGAPVQPTPPGGIPSSEINSALFGSPSAPGAAAAPAGQPVTGLPATGVLPAQPPAAAAAAVAPGQPVATVSISDEQDFQAVSSRETIESDKARIEANKAQYQQIAPTELPERTAGGVSPIIDYALNAPNRLGQAIYDRRTTSPEAHQKACLRYPTPEAAQEAFLKAGGPKRDGKKLDPDGDGFACDWDPTPFQKARGG